MNTFTSTRKIRTDAQIDFAYEANEAYRKMMQANTNTMKAYADVTITPAQIKELETIKVETKKAYAVYFTATTTK